MITPGSANLTMACRRKVQPVSPDCSVEPSSHFFKVILRKALADKKLGIPQLFVEKHGNELSAVAKLIIPDGRAWEVGLTKVVREIWFQDGWDDFVQYYSLCEGSLLVFNYAKSSTFKVLIFDKSACEICYPDKGRKQGEDEQNFDRDQMENKPQSKKCKMEELTEINIANDDKNELEEMGIYVTSKYGHLSKKVRETAINIARSFHLKNPSFMVILQSSNVHRHAILDVPSKFADKYISKNALLITLQTSKGREWPFKIVRRAFGDGGGRRGARLSRGWIGFAKHENLKKGDICLFELIRMKDLVFKVSVFHANIE